MIWCSIQFWSYFIFIELFRSCGLFDKSSFLYAMEYKNSTIAPDLGSLTVNETLEAMRLDMDLKLIFINFWSTDLQMGCLVRHWIRNIIGHCFVGLLSTIDFLLFRTHFICSHWLLSPFYCVFFVSVLLVELLPLNRNANFSAVRELWILINASLTFDLIKYMAYTHSVWAALMRTIQ